MQRRRREEKFLHIARTSSREILFHSRMRELRRLQTFMRISTSSRLQNGPHRIIHRVQVRRVGRPFLGTNEPRKIGLAPVLSFFCLVGRSRVLLKLPDSATEMALGPRLHNLLENFLEVAFVDFYTRIHKNKGFVWKISHLSRFHEQLFSWKCANCGVPSFWFFNVLRSWRSAVFHCVWSF